MPALPPDTERLHFAWWRLSDLGDACALWGDPRVTALIDKRERLPEAEVAQRLRTEIDNAARYGVQYWRLERRDTGAFVGCAGLRPYPEQPDSAWECGFHLVHAAWGQGFASEAGRAVRDFALDVLGVKELYAGHHPENHASRAVLEKLGFVKIDECVYPPTGLVHPWYRVLVDYPRKVTR